MIKPGILTAIFVFIVSCSSAPVQPGGKTANVGTVPFYPQEDFQCGPASLAGVMNYLDVQVTPEGVAKEIYSGSARGTLTIDMLLYAQKRGLDAVQYAGSWDDLRARIDGGQPLIVLVDHGIWVYQKTHFMVVTGYSGNGIFANSGRRERLFIDKDSFLKAWERTNYWTLWIKRK